MNKELNVFTLRMLRDQYEAEHMDTEVEALDEAISALESDGDLISRQAVIDAMATWDWQELYLPIHFKQLLEEIPSAQPNLQPTCNQLATDCISRQAAIASAISGRIRTLPTSEDGENWIRVSEVRESLLNMSSAQQDIAEKLYPYKCYITDQEGLQHEVIHTGDIRRVTGWLIY